MDPNEPSVGMDEFQQPFAGAPSGKEEIFRATYEALEAHGYGDVSIQRIADRSELSKSTIYHHFDDKHDLLMQFTSRLIEEAIQTFVLDEEATAYENLERICDVVFLGETVEGECFEDWAPTTLNAIFYEMRGEAARDPEMRAYFDEMDRSLRQEIVDVLEQGIEEGSLRPHDTESAAAYLLVVLEGGIVFRTSEEDHEWLAGARPHLDAFLADLKAE